MIRVCALPQKRSEFYLQALLTRSTRCPWLQRLLDGQTSHAKLFLDDLYDLLRQRPGLDAEARLQRYLATLGDFPALAALDSGLSMCKRGHWIHNYWNEDQTPSLPQQLLNHLARLSSRCPPRLQGIRGPGSIGNRRATAQITTTQSAGRRSPRSAPATGRVQVPLPGALRPLSQGRGRAVQAAGPLAADLPTALSNTNQEMEPSEELALLTEL